MDADYVFLVFGGHLGQKSDDIGKVGWYPRTSSAEFPHIEEADYKVNGRSFALDKSARPAMKRSLIYKLSYYRNREVNVAGKELGFDRARNYVVVSRHHAEPSHFVELL